MSARLERWGAPVLLTLVAAVWGGTFVLVADVIARYPMYAFLGLRFAVACVAFVVLFPATLRKLDRANVVTGTVAGVFLALGYVFQTWGLAPDVGTTPARAAFITGLYVVIVPLAQAAILRRIPRKATVIGAALALGGMWLLSGAGSGGTWVLGDSLVVVCAVAYSAHMLILGSTGEKHDTLALTFVQLIVVTVLCGGYSLITEKPGLPTDGLVWFAILFTGVFASAAAFAIQTWAQRRMQPARAALILVTEPAFGGVFGWTVAGVWPVREVLGAALMLGGMITSEAMAAKAETGERVVFEPSVEGMPVPVVEESHD